MKTQWIDSVPLWALKPRPRDPFGENFSLVGIHKIIDRLHAIKKLSKQLNLKEENELRSSGYSLLEIETDIQAYKKYNYSTAISYHRLKTGILEGRYPKWLAMSAPQFGYEGAQRGGILSKRNSDYQMAMDLHIEAINRSQELEQMGIGAGITIWWPAFDTRLVDDPDNLPREPEEAWDIMINFWETVLRRTSGRVWLKWKTGNPGISYLTTLELAINFCQTINSELGRRAMFIDNEFSYILLSGISISEATLKTLEAGLFQKIIHVNSGQMLSKPLHILLNLEKYAEPKSILIGYDWNWPVGQTFWNDQEKAIELLDKCGQKTIYCEHDVNPAGLDPLKILKTSIKNRQKMLKNIRGKENL